MTWSFHACLVFSGKLDSSWVMFYSIAACFAILFLKLLLLLINSVGFLSSSDSIFSNDWYLLFLYGVVTCPCHLILLMYSYIL